MYPKLFKQNEYEGIPIMPYIDGWFNLIENLCDDLVKEIGNLPFKTQEEFSVSEIKSKFRKLKFRLYGPITPWMEELVNTAEDRSQSICQFCGEPGKPKEKGRWLIICPVHDKYYPDIEDSLRESAKNK